MVDVRQEKTCVAVNFLAVLRTADFKTVPGTFSSSPHRTPLEPCKDPRSL